MCSIEKQENLYQPNNLDQANAEDSERRIQDLLQNHSTRPGMCQGLGPSSATDHHAHLAAVTKTLKGRRRTLPKPVLRLDQSGD